MMDDLTALREEIEDRYGTVYRFCRASGLSKSLVYPLLQGRYQGDAGRQTARIRAVLAGRPALTDRLYAVIRRVMCGRCAGVSKARCESCRELIQELARAVGEEVDV